MDTETVTAVAAALSAIAGSAGALAAWRAANASWRTGRDASEALALVVRPRIWVRAGVTPHNGSHRIVVRLKNASDHDAVDLEVEVRGRDGRSFRDSFPRVRPTHHRTWKHIDRENDITLDLGEYGLEIERVLVRHFDARRLARYEHEERYMVERHGPDAHGITTEGRWTETRDERVEGP